MTADHHTLVQTLIAWLYLGANSLRIVSYLPQIRAVWRAHDGAPALSLVTWGSWTVSHSAAMLYGTVVIGDTFLAIVSTINLAGCSAVSGIVVQRRLALRRAGAPAGALVAAQNR